MRSRHYSSSDAGLGTAAIILVLAVLGLAVYHMISSKSSESYEARKYKQLLKNEQNLINPEWRGETGVHPYILKGRKNGVLKEDVTFVAVKKDRAGNFVAADPCPTPVGDGFLPAGVLPRGTSNKLAYCLRCEDDGMGKCKQGSHQIYGTQLNQ